MSRPSRSHRKKTPSTARSSTSAQASSTPSPASPPSGRAWLVASLAILALAAVLAWRWRQGAFTPAKTASPSASAESQASVSRTTTGASNSSAASGNSAESSNGAESSESAAGRDAGAKSSTSSSGLAAHRSGAGSESDTSGAGSLDPGHVDIPPPETAEFRNASTAVGYVGSGECLECHRQEYDSYLRTTHSRSLAKVDLAHEPPDGQFSHDLSGRKYSVYREGGELHLRESVAGTGADMGAATSATKNAGNNATTSGSDETVLTDVTASYSLGSGNYARMYLVRRGRFLIEAPMTWYPRRDCWGMSAGYEKDPHQHGFSREIDAHCLSCHAGRVETPDGASQLLDIKEMAIGCERCHGPGALHVAERRAKRTPDGPIDRSIVNVRHLSRARQEDVCAQCHLSASADVLVRGRRVADFRPGMRLADFRINYRVDRPEAAMTVSGQIEQMRLSRCYVKSEQMSCATCHNPHAPPPQSERIAYFRNKCLQCHPEEKCRMPVAERKAKDANDYCVTCHMPRGPTDIPHFSFTHHRIGVHSPQAESAKLTAADKLVPVVDLSHLPKLEQTRLLGLANDIFSSKLAGGYSDERRDDPSYKALAEVFRDRAERLLRQVRDSGLREPETEIFFSRYYWRVEPAKSIAHAAAALEMPTLSPTARQTALYNLASSYFDQRQFDRALPYLRELVKIERSEITLMLLAICHEAKGDWASAESYVNEAIADSPDRADLRIHLADIYKKLGRPDDAANQLRLAKLLTRKIPQPQ